MLSGPQKERYFINGVSSNKSVCRWDGEHPVPGPGVSVRTCNNIKIIYSHPILISLPSTATLHATCREYLRYSGQHYKHQMHNCLFSSQHLNMHADVPGPGPRLDVLMLVILFIGGTKYFTRILTLRRGNKQFTDISGRILSSPHSDLLTGLELSTKIRDSEKVLC